MTTYITFEQGTGFEPRIVRVYTTETLSTITAAGWLNSVNGNQKILFQSTDQLLISYAQGTSSATTASFTLAIVAATGIITLSLASSAVVLPVVSGHIAVFSGTAGAIADTSTTAIHPANIQAGLSGTAGKVISYPATASTGSLQMTAVSNSGDTITTISNAAMGQASTVSIPDPGASTANFLLSTGTANILTDFQQIVSLTDIIIASVGTWTRTRVAQANYSLVHTPADDTSNISFDITPIIRTTASKGLKLNSIDVVYSIGVAALDAHTLTLDSVAYANNVAVAVTSVPLTGSLSIATQSNPYVTNVTVSTPAFLVTADAKYVLELTVNAAATSTYSLYGLNLRFSQTIG